MNELPIKILRFRSGEESYPAILNEEELQTSPFSFTVNSALSSIEDLYKGDKLPDKSDFSDFKYNTPNNIIAFLGDRGSGKTSCMRTAIEMCKLRHKEWLILDEIDPSFFDETHNILDIFIGTLYGMFKEEMDKWASLSRSQQERLRGINDKFRNVKSALRYIGGNVQFEDEYETEELCHLNEGGKLSQLLYELISELLEYKEKKFLVVSIDDLDLNISCSHEMLEQLRKYLIIPNATIIISARFDQLFDNICLALTKYYKEIPDRVSKKDIAEMAERYLNKVLPLNRRFEMPSVDSYMDAIILFGDETNQPGKQSERLVSIRVPDLIFKKTRYLFYNTSGIPSLVIPRNLRDLRMLVSMLSKMDDFTDENKNNQITFKNYFFNEWMGIIEPEYRPFIKRLLEEEDLAKLNRFVIRNLYEFFLKETESLDRLVQDIRENEKQNIRTYYTRHQLLLSNILNPSNSYWNVSVGDVVVIMNAVRKIHDSAKILSLLFVITTVYSIKLYETYNLMTDLTDENGLKFLEDQPTTNPELKTSVRADIPSYFRLLGGTFFADSGDTFIPVGQDENEQRGVRLINAKFLFSEIRSVVSEYNNLASSNNKSTSPLLSARLRLCEFFMLSIKERVDQSRNTNRRLISEPLYFAPFVGTAKNLLFDITRPFLSCVYPKFSYDRFDKDIYSIALKEKESILNRMRKHGVSRGKDNDTWELMSKAAIRNMEILEDLTAWMYRKREEIRPGGNGLLGALKCFFDTFEIVQTEKGKMPTKGYCVKTYSKSEQLKDNENNKELVLPYYRIDYSIYSELGRFLGELDSSSQPHDLRHTFDAIMSEKDIIILRKDYDKSEVCQALYPYCGHSVVDLAFGLYTDRISLTDLSLVLAEITVENRFDFGGRLPKELEFYYNSAVTTLYTSKVEKLTQKRSRLEDAVTDAKESVRSRMEDMKILKQEKSQCSKLLTGSEVQYNEISAELETLSKDLSSEDFSQIDNLTKTQIAVLEKKKNTVLSLRSKQVATQANITTYRENLERIETLLEDLEKSVRFFNQSQKKNEREIKIVNDDIERLSNNINKRIPI